ncbi:TonB-dependent siderophore receptor [Steroidobacter sp.]|uniref:TonB-dependent siderophore receptor n=1 Tax=Steroidobacter sp. TaxID=1978227 RepID=UPI001A395D99|nr:TonB-dependent siderophore receptor [Steroidobacter sp.]MBL8265375.1 TonB-dependent siderophore receptor [Steroidobacter sp.]
MKSFIAAVAAATGSETTTKKRGKHSRATQLLALSLLSPICVVAAAETQRFDIPAQALPDALKVFADQSRMQLLYKPEALSGGVSTTVVGDLEKRAALELLLKGTGFEVVFSKGNAATIRPAGFGKSSANAAGHAGDSSAVSDGDVSDVETVMVFGTLENRLSVASKSGQSLRETPKSVTIMTGERIEAQNLTSLQEALIQTTGVSVSAFNPLETFYYSRGIKLETLQFDGGAPAYTGGLGISYTPDTATIEQIQVLRGVDGMYSGAGEPGGVVNLVRKRPERTAAMRVNLSAGTWDNYRAILDATGPLALDGRLRGRAVASYMDRGYHLDRYTTEKQILYGVLEFDATDSTLLAAGLSYEKRDDKGYPGWGTPRYTNGTTLDVPREYSIAPPWTYWNSDTLDAFARVEQKYGETGVIRLNLNQIEQDSDLNYVTFSTAVNPVTYAGARMFRRRADISTTQRLADLSASGKWQLFGREHSYTVGMDYTKLSGTELSYTVIPTNIIPITNFYAYNPATFAEPATVPSSYYPFRERQQQGYYATIGLQLAAPLRLTIGGRYGTFHYDHALRTLATGATSYLRYDEEEFIPSAALSYSLSDRWTAYLSYGETFNPQGNLFTGPPPGNDPLTPVVGNNLELGIKGDVFEGVTAAASIYRLKREGQGAADLAYVAVTDPSTGVSCCYVQHGDIIVEGMDLEMSGRVVSGWQVFGGYTFTQTDYVGGPTGATTLGRTPKHQLKIWSTYQLPGRFSALTLNAGVTAQTSTYFGSSPFNAALVDLHYGGITLWNASAQYALTDKWTLAVYSENLTDKVYWQPTGNLNGQNVYGNPRSVTVSIRGGWLYPSIQCVARSSCARRLLTLSMSEPMKKLLLCVLLYASASNGASRPETFTLAESAAAHASMSGRMIVGAHSRYILSSDGNNLFAATAPTFQPRQVTSYTDKAGLGNISMAPDGRSVFYIRGRKQRGFESYPAQDTRELIKLDIETGQTMQVAGAQNIPSGSLAFSKDARAFAFSEGKMLWEFRQQAQGWARRPLLENNPEHYAAVYIEDLAYSPDGTQLAFSSQRKAGQRYVGVVDLATLKHRYLSPGIFRDSKPVWSPDGKQLLFVRVPGNWTMAYRFSEQSRGVPWSLELADPKSGDVRTLWRADVGAGSVLGPEFEAPIWTRDGQILFLWEKTGWQLLYSMAASGGAPRLLTPGEGEVSHVTLNAAGTRIAYGSNIGDLPRQHVWQLSLNGGQPQRVVQGTGMEAWPVFTADDALFYTANVNGRMPNRRLVAMGKNIVTLTPTAAEETKFRKIWDQFVDIEVLPVRAEDGILTHHLLMVPRGKAPAGGYPVIVTAKGGPTGRVLPGQGYVAYPSFAQYAVSRGYIVLEINYRGSTSFGLDYRFPAERGATGGSEVKDLAALARYLKSRPDVDPKRIGIAGHSYGGHIVGLALSRLSEDFAAGIHMSGVGDWLIEMKKDGETVRELDGPPEFMPLSERMKIEDLARASSSTSSIANWRAPTLFIMGEMDTAGHMESVIDLGYRLMERGTPTQFYIVPDSGHADAKVFPLQKMFDFFERM